MNAAIKKAVLDTLAFSGKALSIPKLVELSGYNLFLPFYHTVGNEPAHIRHLYPVRTGKQFRDDLEFILKHFQPLSIEGLTKGIEEGFPKGKRFFFLSFDDGLSEVYHTAFPILEKMGVPFAIFINPAFVGNKKLFFPHKASLILEALERNIIAKKEIANKLCDAGIAKKNINAGLRAAGHKDETILDEAAALLGIDFEEYLRREKPYMTLEQIRELHSAGVAVGGHSMDHPLYSRLSLEEQLHQTTESIAYVQENFGVRQKLFAFPFTDHGVGAEFFRRVHEANSPLADITFGCAGLKKQAWPHHLQRVPMEAYSSSAEKQIRGKYVYCSLQQLLGMDKIKRA